jgi:hypothetical protein
VLADLASAEYKVVWHTTLHPTLSGQDTFDTEDVDWVRVSNTCPVVRYSMTPHLDRQRVIVRKCTCAVLHAEDSCFKYDTYYLIYCLRVNSNLDAKVIQCVDILIAQSSRCQNASPKSTCLCILKSSPQNDLCSSGKRYTSSRISAMRGI